MSDTYGLWRKIDREGFLVLCYTTGWKHNQDPSIKAAKLELMLGNLSKIEVEGWIALLGIPQDDCVSPLGDADE